MGLFRRSRLRCSAESAALGGAALGADHPGELFHLTENLVQDVGARGVFVVDLVVHLAAGRYDGLDSC